MANYLKISVAILFTLSASRFIPHPPNFTSLIALSFYVPIIFGLKFIPIVVMSFAITDLYFGFHNTILFTWGSVILIGLITNYLSSGIFYRVLGVLFGASIFFVLSNFGVWLLSDIYANSITGLMACYIFALPFFYSTILSTISFSIIFEVIIISKRIYEDYFKASVS